ncbi:hypothetical protein CR513_57135, partial [Mucuna pruriens]
MKPLEFILTAHVWGQFCLCYDGQKLVTEKDYLRNYGIKDGDQLRFIRHVSNNCCVQRKRLKKRVVCLKQRRATQVNSYQPKENCGDGEVGSDDEATENKKMEQEEEEGVGKNKLAGFMGELFSYTPLAVVRRTSTKSRIWPSTIPRCLMGSFRKIRSIEEALFSETYVETVVLIFGKNVIFYPHSISKQQMKAEIRSLSKFWFLCKMRDYMLPIVSDSVAQTM